LKDYINFIIGALLLVSFIGLVEINDNYVTGYGVAPVRQQSSQQGHVDVNKIQERDDDGVFRTHKYHAVRITMIAKKIELNS